MDPSRIEAYIRSTCSVLDFDIGELWCAKKGEGTSTTLKFLQLYTSPTYEDFHSVLIQPDPSHDDAVNRDESKHRFSPLICRSVCDGGQIVWANTRITEGLTGRREMPLNTAVGVPICSINNDLYLLVLFAVGLNQMSPNAVEYLISVVRAVAMTTGGFLPAAFATDVQVTAPQAKDFVGLWDITELIQKYTNSVDFKLLPMNKLQRYFDCHEMLLFCDLFHDYKITRNGTFTQRQVESLQETIRNSFSSVSSGMIKNDAGGRNRSDSIDSHSWEMNDDKLPVIGNDDATTPCAATAAASTATEVNRESSNSTPDSTTAGVYCADISEIKYDMDSNQVTKITFNSVQIDANQSAHSNSGDAQNRDVLASGGFEGIITADKHENATVHPGQVLAMLKQVADTQPPDDTIMHVYAHMSYKLNQCRYHEFMIAVLGMTVFDCAELWLLSESRDELYLMAAVYRTKTMQKWTALSEKVRLKVGCDVPGRILETEQFCWEPNYVPNEGTDSSTSSTGSRESRGSSLSPDGEAGKIPSLYRSGPRVHHAEQLGIKTAFGVPVPGMKGICGAMVFYSAKRTIELEPLMVELIERAVQIMAKIPLEEPSSYTCAVVDMEGAANDRKQVSRWMRDERGVVNRQGTFQRRLQILEHDQEMEHTSGGVNGGGGGGGGGGIGGGQKRIFLPGQSLDLSNRMQLAQSIVKDRKAVVEGPQDKSSFEGGLVNSTLQYNRQMEYRSAADAMTQLAAIDPSFKINVDIFDNEASSEEKTSSSSGAATAALPSRVKDAGGAAGGDPHMKRKQTAANTFPRRPSSVSIFDLPPQASSVGGLLAKSPRSALAEVVSVVADGGHYSMGNNNSIYNFSSSNGKNASRNSRSNMNHSISTNNDNGGDYISNIGSTYSMSPTYAPIGSLNNAVEALTNFGRDQPNYWNDSNSYNMRKSNIAAEGDYSGEGYSATQSQQHVYDYYSNVIKSAAVSNMYCQPASMNSGSSTSIKRKAKDLGEGRNKRFDKATTHIASFDGNIGKHVASGASVSSSSSSSFADNHNQQQQDQDQDQEMKCRVDNCNNICVDKDASQPYCASHRGTRRCQFDGCGKCAQGATKFCISHGGGRRCTFPNCFKGARDKLFCAAHGGGKRCQQEGCTKSAVGGSNLCTAHGGGKRCKYEGCNKSSQSCTDYCVKHGGGRSCQFRGCNKVARGKTEFCAAHGGGVRCRVKGCHKIAVGSTFVCRLHGSDEIEAAESSLLENNSTGTGQLI